MLNVLLIGLGIVLVVLFFVGIRIIRPIEKGLIETLGKYSKTAEQGFHWIVPIIQTMRTVNITEQMSDVPEQVVQTSDKLNTSVDAMVYYQVADVVKAEYNVDNHRVQLTSLARTTLRAVMGNLTLTECIQKRNDINSKVEEVLDKETDSYGVKVLRVEVQKIDPLEDVQMAMNNVVKAEQSKIASKDTALALEIEADGHRLAQIKKAEGAKQSSILKAEGEAKAFEMINRAFVGNAQVLKKLEVTQASLQDNTKILLTEKGINPQIIIGDIPIKLRN